jgi:hypothetical protein
MSFSRKKITKLKIIGNRSSDHREDQEDEIERNNEENLLSKL